MESSIRFIIKFTSKRWKRAALSGESVRFGNMLYYRDIEDERFRDKEEGLGRYEISSSVPFPSTELSRLFPDSRNPLPDDWTVELGGASIRSECGSFNCIVFCCSIVDDFSEIASIQDHFGAEDYYIIADPLLFIKDAGEKILEQIKVKALEDMSKVTITKDQIDSLQLHDMNAPITYTDEPKINRVADNELANFDPRTIIMSQIFTKPNRFQMERELRFI